MSEIKKPYRNPSQPLNLLLSGERSRRARIEKIVEHLRGLEQLRHQPTGDYSWQKLLAGEVDEVSGGGVHPNSKLCVINAGAHLAKGVFSLGGSIESGADYKKLAAEHPTQRYKFYHSLGDLAQSEAYLTEVIRQADERGLSLTMKSFDHAYDGINLYTFHFQELREIVAETYKHYPDAFMSTEHFLQGDIRGIDPRHIGWVQEPIAGLGHQSHSGRMGQVGTALDEAGVTADAYMAGCEAAGVMPDMPWLLNPAYEQQLIDRAGLHT